MKLLQQELHKLFKPCVPDLIKQGISYCIDNHTDNYNHKSMKIHFNDNVGKIMEQVFIKRNK